jgi:hypothetical protein
MRLIRLSVLPTALALFAACSRDSGVTVNDRPPLGGVRFINAVADGGPVDIRMVDQVEWSASSVNGTNTGLAFRAGTNHWATEAKARQIRVFPTDSSITVTTQVLHDTTITIEANKNVTLMLVGSRAAGGHISFIKIDDTPPALSGAKIAVRFVNASSTGSTPTNADAYLTASASTSVTGTTPSFAGLAPRSASPYVVRDTAQFAVRTAAAADQTTLWSAAAPAGAPAAAGIAATAGAGGPGSAMSAYLFPRSAAGSAAPAGFTTPDVVWFIDLVPAP